MRTLRTKFNKFQDEFEQVMRTSNKAMYKRTSNDTGNISGYEVIKVLTAKKDIVINGDTIQQLGDEVYPNSEAFGESAWMFTNYQLALKKYNSLN